MNIQQDFPGKQTKNNEKLDEEIDLESENNNQIFYSDDQHISIPQQNPNQNEQDDEGISSSLFSSSKINLMEIDSLEDVFTTSVSDGPPEEAGKYLEWEESLSDISNSQFSKTHQQQQLNNVTHDGIRGLLNNFLGLESTEIPNVLNCHKIHTIHNQNPLDNQHQNPSMKQDVQEDYSEFDTGEMLEKNLLVDREDGLETLEEPSWNYLVGDSDTDSDNDTKFKCGRESDTKTETTNTIQNNVNNHDFSNEMEINAEFDGVQEFQEEQFDIEDERERTGENLGDPNQILIDQEPQEEILNNVDGKSGLKLNPFYFHSMTNMIQDFPLANQSEYSQNADEIQIQSTLSEQIISTSNSNPNSDSENSGVEDFLTKIHGQPKMKLGEDTNRNKLFAMERMTMETIDEEENPETDPQEIKQTQQNETEQKVDQEKKNNNEKTESKTDDENEDADEDEWTDCLSKTPQDSPSHSIQVLSPVSQVQIPLDHVFITKSDSESSSNSTNSSSTRIFVPNDTQSTHPFKSESPCQNDQSRIKSTPCVSSAYSQHNKNLLISASSPLQNNSPQQNYEPSSVSSSTSPSFLDEQKTEMEMENKKQSSQFITSKTKLSSHQILKENSSKNILRKRESSRQNIKSTVNFNEENVETLKKSNQKLAKNSSRTSTLNRMYGNELNQEKENWPNYPENNKSDMKVTLFSGSLSHTKNQAPQNSHTPTVENDAAERGKELSKSSSELECDWSKEKVIKSGSDSPAFPEMTITMTSDICPGPKQTKSDTIYNNLNDNGDFELNSVDEQEKQVKYDQEEEEEDLNGNSTSCSATEDFADEIGDSSWNKNTTEFVDNLFVKINVPLKVGEEQLRNCDRIVRFPLDIHDKNSCMVLAINSHLPQLHSEYLETPKEISFKISPTLEIHQKFLIGVVKIRCRIAIPVTYKLSSVGENILEMTTDSPWEGVVFPRESVEIQVYSKLPTPHQQHLEQLQIEGIVIYAAPFIFNRGFNPENLGQKDINEFWSKFNGFRTRFAQIKFIPIKISGELAKESDGISKRFFNGIWKFLSHLNIIKNEVPEIRYGKMKSKDVLKVRGSSLSQLILRRNINIYRILRSRVDRLNDYRTTLIISTILCAAGAFFYFYAYEPEMAELARTKIRLTFWEHCKIVLPKLWITPKTQTFNKIQ